MAGGCPAGPFVRARVLPRETALRVALHAARARALAAESAALLLRAQQEQGSVAAVLREEGLDPAAWAVVTEDDGPLHLGTVVDAKTGVPWIEEIESAAPAPELAPGAAADDDARAATAVRAASPGRIG